MVALPGQVPGSLQSLGTGVESVQISLDRHGAVLMQQVGPPGEYTTRNHRRDAASSATATGQAPVITIPTDNVAAWVLFNPVDNTRDFVIDKVFCWSISGTLGLGMGLIVAVSLGLQTTAPTNVANSVMSSLSGSPFDSKAIFGSAHTITPSTVPAWCVVATRHQVSAVAVGSGLSTTAQFRGSRVIRPGREIGINVLAPVGTDALFGAGVEWHEVDK